MPTKQALQLMERYNRSIAGLEDATVERLHTAMDKAYRNLEKELRATYPAIASNTTLLASQRKVLILEQLGEALQVVRPDQADYYQQSLQETLQTANQTGRTMADELIQAVDPASAVASLSNVAIEAAALQARDGFERLRRHSEEFRGKASAIVEQGLIQGWGPAKVADLLRNELKTTKSKAETIARTETLSALNDASQQRYAENGVEGVQWICTVGDVCPYCSARNTQVYPVGKVRAPAHPRCLPAGVVVSAPFVQASASRKYAGEVVVIQTASGKELTATPNHPVLTPQGWVAIDSLSEGDSVFSCLDSERVTSAIAPDHYNRPTLIEEIVASFSKSTGMSSRSMKVSPEDFHGDGKGSEVCVVSADRLLWDKFTAQTLEPALELNFERRLVAQLGLLTDRLPAFLLPSNYAPPACGMCSGNLFNSLGFRHLLPLQKLGFGLGANNNSGVFQNSPNRRSLHLEGSGNEVFRLSRTISKKDIFPNQAIAKPEPLPDLPGFNFINDRFSTLQPSFFENSTQEVGIEPDRLGSVLDRFSGLIFQDRIIKTFRKRFSGHVYNLETQTGWYFANDIITHNCRCILLPWKASWQEKGLTDEAFIKDYQEQRLNDLDEAGLKPNRGVTPFEKAAGLTEPPKPIWTVPSAKKLGRLEDLERALDASEPLTPEFDRLLKEWVAESNKTPVVTVDPRSIKRFNGYPEVLLEDQHVALIDRGRAVAGTKNLKAIDAALQYDELVTNFKKAQKALEDKPEYKRLLDEDITTAFRSETGKKILEIQGQIDAEKQKLEAKALKAMQAIRRNLVSSIPREQAEALASQVKILKSATKEMSEAELRSQLADFYQITGGRGSDNIKKIKLDDDRAYASFGGELNIGRNGSDRERSTTLFHEMGHHVEFEQRDTEQALNAWLKSRATGDPKPLNQLGLPHFGDDEIAVPDRFIDQYVGKVYDDGSTEVLSMGIQHFVNEADMLKLYRKDPEHFLLTIGAIR